jgi:hypothetical protein
MRHKATAQIDLVRLLRTPLAIQKDRWQRALTGAAPVIGLTAGVPTDARVQP